MEVMDAAHLPLVHLNLTVSDLDESAAFYGRWFGFTGSRRTYADGTVFLSNADGFDLALHPGAPSTPPGRGTHFGFRAGDADTVRDLLQGLLAGDVIVPERHDDPDHVSLKCLDPDGYEIEVYWEPPADTRLEPASAN